MSRVNTIYFEDSIFGSGAAQPNFVFERSGNVNTNNWLYAGRVVSNKTGQPLALEAAELVQVWVRCQLNATFDITLYEHDGNGAGLTSIATVSVVGTNSADFSTADFGTINPTTGRQLAVRLTSGSAKELRVFLIIRGVFVAV